MKSILAISGSASSDSSNAKLLRVVGNAFAHTYQIEVKEGLWQLPLYTPQLEQVGIPDVVQQLRSQLAAAHGIIICTPEYAHNIPAVLKNMLEWVTNSGELYEKPVLPITFTPAAPRGKYAMHSLLQTLQACNAKIVTELPLYRNQMTNKETVYLDGEHKILLSEALELL